MSERIAIGFRFGLLWGVVTVGTWFVLVLLTKYFIPGWQPESDALMIWIVPLILFFLVAIPAGIYRAINPW